MTQPWDLRLPVSVFERLEQHLFGTPGPRAGVLLAGVAEASGSRRLLAREFVEAQDGIDYLTGRGRGHHRLAAAFVRDAALRASAENLAYLAVHTHGGDSHVGFSGEDLASHENGYPALLDIVGGPPVGALVFARGAVAGDIWTRDGRALVREAVILGPGFKRLRPEPMPVARADPRYDRQARLFGDAGQAILRASKVGVIGAGGMGMLLVEYLARLGVGHLVVVDPDRVEPSNLPRLPGSRRSDARVWFNDPWLPTWLRTLGRKRARPKVDLAARLAREADPAVRVDRLFADVRQPEVAAQLLDCDYLFLAANSDQARFLFNAICQQFLIPGAQLGAKVGIEPATGMVTAVHSVGRTVFPGQGCLWCNGAVSPTRMAEEAASPAQRRAQRYVDDPDVVAPSVITLNATAASLAANDFMFSVTGLTPRDAPLDWVRVHPLARDVQFDRPRRDPDCLECAGRFARGSLGPRLPTYFR
ncbi:MAG: ThiF family adenylyltransferase [Chloroflexi bacterium]|nr:ThiF family adenylyltransferase [Chloroflexota bacterium]